MERFWSKVAKAGENDCWQWTGAKSKRGYGMFHISKKPPKVSQAHRVAYALAVSDPGELHVLHSCDNPSCCNPAHLWLGTNQDNVDDRVAKNRSSGGTPFHKQPPKRINGRFCKSSASTPISTSEKKRMNKAKTTGVLQTTDERAPTSSPWGPVQSAKRLADGIWSVSTSGHGGIWLSNERVAELHELMGYSYPTFCRDYQWYEEDCDWVMPVIAFRIQDSYENACKQLRSMSKRWLDRTIFKQAHDALVKAGCILDHEKVSKAIGL